MVYKPQKPVESYVMNRTRKPKDKLVAKKPPVNLT